MKKKTIGMILLGLTAFALVGSGAAKLFAAPEPGMSEHMISMLPIMAVIEFLIVAALAIPKTRKLGIILAASYFGRYCFSVARGGAGFSGCWRDFEYPAFCWCGVAVSVVDGRRYGGDGLVVRWFCGSVVL